ncbi:Dsc3p NDAI_0E01390 [Naumovozyma dairenensis CBS 421]|uniref:DSC E3 ubiquitin ligase complex subunit 3 C-terminal domain-containing protein n=1 Tax=Naumovozyma dairenensis (strain ATCC 10597 / BCRC 20456 / CBS 421 / NBRC 0211 / NRRL Y-12639) TaxID=1071378 RepID=G0WB35_NAUDC|nr:hypothetical protein NDAI_0E01390 [Naumovozyma dairenensis CBS 421]CCD24955.1 hypothetical protein NDAI_0E01390 [Naumovozyma dairenensis CBS 421]
MSKEPLLPSTNQHLSRSLPNSISSQQQQQQGTSSSLSRNGRINSRYIVIRFSDERIKDIELNITNVSLDVINTAWLRRMCRELRPSETTSHRLKFIRNGVLLNLHTNLKFQLSQYFNQVESEESDERENKIYVHCIVGTDILTPEELQDEDKMDEIGQNQDGTTTQAIGFDRLRAVGFSEQEVELLRQQFRATYGDLQNENDDYEQNQHPNNEQNNNNDIRQLEEQWMESGTNGNNGNVFDTNSDRFNSIPITNFKHNKDLLIGIFIGFTFGIFSFLLMKIDGLFNKRQKMSMFAGIMVNIIFCFVKGF